MASRPTGRGDTTFPWLEEALGNTVCTNRKEHNVLRQQRARTDMARDGEVWMEVVVLNDLPALLGRRKAQLWLGWHRIAVAKPWCFLLKP